MRSGRWLGTVAATALLLNACTQPLPGRTANASPAASPKSTTSASAQPGETPCLSTQRTPSFNPPFAPSDRNLAIIWLKGSQKFVVRDITDILHPSTISEFANLGNPQFVSAAEISYVDGTDLMRMPLSGSPKSTVAECVKTNAFAWNPTATSAAYITVNPTTSVAELHLVLRGQNQHASNIAPLPIAGCESRSCSDDVDFRLMYSPNGSYISLVQPFGEANLRMWTSEGQTIMSGSSAMTDLGTKPTMSVWSGKNFYWRSADGVQLSRDGAASPGLPGVRWIRPKASPGGSQIVYATRDSSGTAHIYLLDTAANVPRELTKSRSEPAFLNPHLIWYKEERPCVASDQCPPDAKTIPSGKTYIYDLQDNTETESVIAAVFDVWPHAA
jgi:hypothetical protein